MFNSPLSISTVLVSESGRTALPSKLTFPHNGREGMWCGKEWSGQQLRRFYSPEKEEENWWMLEDFRI